MKKYSIIISILCFYTTALLGQTAKSHYKAASIALDAEDYYSAVFHLQKVIELDGFSTQLDYDLAKAFYFSYSLIQSKEYFKKVKESKEILNYPDTYYYLGKVEKQLGNYEAALHEFNKFLTIKALNKNKDFTKDAKRESQQCLEAQRIKVSDTISIRHLEKSINTAYSEFAPFFYKDTLYYSSYRFVNKEDEQEPQRRITKVLSSVKSAKGRTLRHNFNEKEKHTAHTAFNSDKSRIYFTICDYKAGTKIHCNIYYRDKNKRGRWEQKARALPSFINSNNYTSTQPTIGFDSLRQKEILIFASDRPGGKGKSDLWLSVISGNTFQKPINLSEINTPDDEITPYFHSPSQSLWFSTDGYFNLGGYDIYSAQKDSLTWQKPTHYPPPLNSSYNDIYFFKDSYSSKAYLSSNRAGSYYLDKTNKTCCNDIYEVSFLSPQEPTKSEEPLVSIAPPSSQIKNPEDKEPQTLEDFLPLALYFDNDEPDKRTRRISTKKTYEQTYIAYAQRQQEYIAEYAAPLQNINREEAEQKMKDFFENKVTKGFRHLFLFSDILLKRLQQGEQVEIFVKGYTSPRAKSDYNKNLGKRRISSVRNHFANYAGGIFAAYINKGKLIITERSFGETKADNNVSDDLEDLRNSVYSIGAAKERRVEIIEIKVD